MLLLLAISLFVFSSCSDGESDEDIKANNFEISGTVKGASGKKIFLIQEPNNEMDIISKNLKLTLKEILLNIKKYHKILQELITFDFCFQTIITLHDRNF